MIKLFSWQEQTCVQYLLTKLPLKSVDYCSSKRVLYAGLGAGQRIAALNRGEWVGSLCEAMKRARIGVKERAKPERTQLTVIFETIFNCVLSFP